MSYAYRKTVEHIFDAVLDDHLTSRALQAVADYVGVSGAGCALMNKFTGRVSWAAWWGSFRGNPADYMSHYGKIDPSRAIWDEASACGRLLRVSESLPQSLLRNDEWYNDWLLAGGVCDILGTNLYESTAHKMSFGLYRAVGETSFFPTGMEQLHQLTPVLRSAACLHVGLIEIGYSSHIGNGRVGDLGPGVIFANASGQVVETNSIGETLLCVGDGLTIQDGRICARRNFETAKLASLIASATGSESGLSTGCMLVARHGGRSSYIVRVAPVRAGMASYDLPMAMILVSAPDENRVSEGELSELYGLSPAESRVALALAQGKRLTTLAAEFGVQITTVRTQLSSILKKCEVERQSDLVRLISDIPVVHPRRNEADPV